MGHSPGASSVHEDSYLYMTAERKYYQREQSFIKRSLREKEYHQGPYGPCIPHLSKERLQNEAECLRFIHSNTNIPVPAVYADFEDDGAYYLVTEFIQGVEMNDLPMEKKNLVGEELKQHLHTLHSLKSTTIGGPSGLLVPPRSVIESTTQDHWVLQPSNTGEEEYVFCHNDLSEYNVIVNPETSKIAAIIDWEHGSFFPEYFEAPIYIHTARA
ncbi:protein kinase-like protein [Fusarium austroafricanum]|uniref:Protein kinase-like protein n=1 Tax=Fusarium austroafricanum TaxID=2364996 RepID=A0A8H4KDB1_9HYPO|nr:protein kinase-like protein [Fusarium austroafricanum]